jgi:hypothetical protein
MFRTQKMMLSCIRSEFAFVSITSPFDYYGCILLCVNSKLVWAKLLDNYQAFGVQFQSLS